MLLPTNGLLRTELHSFPMVSWLEFSSHFLEGVHAVIAVRWLLQSQLCCFRCPMCEWRNYQNKQLTRAALSQSSPIVILWEKQQQQESQGNVMHNMDVLIKLPGIVREIILLINNLQDCFCLNQYPSHVQQGKSTSGTWNSSYIHVCMLKRTSQFCKSLVGLLKFFPLETLLTAHPNSATINWFVENWEACLPPSALQLTCCQVSCSWLVCLLDHKHKGKGMWFNSQQPFVGRSIAWQRKKWLCSRLGPKGLKDEFWLYKIEKMCCDSAFTAVKRGVKF